MQTLKVESETITLPADVLKKLRGKEVQFIEFNDGYIIRPAVDAIRSSRGFLKGGDFSTGRYFGMKQEEKRLEK